MIIMRNDLCMLITTYRDKAEIKEKKTRMFCERKSVTRSEYYQSHAAGVSTKSIFNIHPNDYELAIFNIEGEECLPTKIAVNGQTFDIIRAYQKSFESMEITVG